jgi:hypothetical protein
MKLSYSVMVKALQYLGLVSCERYLQNPLFNNCKILSSKWLDYHKEYSNLYDNPKEQDGITYHGCTNTEFKYSVNMDKIIITHKVWDGNNLNGYRENVRCEFTLEFNKDCKDLMDLLNNLIISEMEWKAKCAYNQELEDAKNKRIGEIFNGMLKDIGV